MTMTLSRHVFLALLCAVLALPAARAGAALPATQPAPAEELTIVLGEIRLLPVPGKVTRVALGSGAVLSATTVDAHLLLIAEKVGETTLMVWTGRRVDTYKVRVTAQDPAAARRRIEALVKGGTGIAVDQVGPDIVLSGVAQRDTLARLNKAVDGMPNVINNVAEDAGSAFTRSVLFRLHFIEVKKALIEEIGIDWAKSAAGPVIGVTGVARNSGIYGNLPAPRGDDNLLAAAPDFVTRNGRNGGVFLGLATTIASRLHFGINNGDARVLASPELTARSGGKAHLQVGGEIPIPLSGAFGATTVEYKPYGILFSVEPQIAADDAISARLSTELSQIDPSISIGGIPGFVTRTTATEISVRPGEVVALSGLINSELSSSIDRVPALSRIPIFGRLFRSDDFRNSRSELVVLVETEIVAAGDGLAGQLRARGLDAQRAFDARSRASAPAPFPPGMED